MFCTKNTFTRKTVPLVSLFQIFLLGQTAVKFRNSQIYENCQLWYILNYFNLFRVFVHIFEKLEERFLDHILNNSNYLTAFVIFLKPPCYVNLLQAFLCFFVVWVTFLMVSYSFFKGLYVYSANVSQLKWISKWETWPP